MKYDNRIKMRKPRVTVLMSVFNGEVYLREAIDSILSQTYHNFEFVIYDDCSTDNTSKIIKSYVDPRIIYRKNQKNEGLTHNLADGVSRSNADYIARMDADDIAYPQRIAKQVEWLDAHPDICILGSAVSYFQDTPSNSNIAVQPTDDASIKATLFISFTLMHPSIMIRRDTLVKNGVNYNPEYRCSQDHALYLDCIRKGLNFANLSQPLLYMRAHAGSISRARHGYQQECSQRARFNFLRETGLDEGCTRDEIDTYNTLASGYYPETVEQVHAYERFVTKIIGNVKTANYFDVRELLHLMADKLCLEAYFAISDKKFCDAALAARKSPLRRYASSWGIKMRIKFWLKCLKNEFCNI